jgi:hypothetical protein
MKCLLAILAISVLVWGSVGVKLGTFGMRKSAATVLKEFAGAVNRILGAIGYIQFYDITDKKPIAPVTADVTLSNIEIMGLKISKEATPDQLNYTLQAASAVIQPSIKGLILAMEGKLSFKWSYKVMGATIYSGDYSARLGTERPALTFTLQNASDKSTGSVGFSWLLIGGEVKGFGASSYIQGQLEEIVKAKLFRVVNEELNRYNDIIVSSMVYNYFYRLIPLPFDKMFNEPVYLKNVFAMFNVGPTDLTFLFQSALYFAIQHVEIALKGLADANDDATSPISLYLGMDSMKQIFDVLMDKSPMKSFVITPEDQQKLLGHSLTVGVLSSFYPRFSEEYEAGSLINIKCAMKPSALSGTKSVAYACQFVLQSDPNVILIDLSELVYTTNVNMVMNEADKTNKTVMVKHSSPRFTKMAVRSPLLPQYLQVQFLRFMQPLALFGGKEFGFSFPIVGPQSNWVFVGLLENSNGDATLTYRF